jgi:hypothetical protein
VDTGKTITFSPGGFVPGKGSVKVTIVGGEKFGLDNEISLVFDPAIEPIPALVSMTLMIGGHLGAMMMSDIRKTGEEAIKIVDWNQEERVLKVEILKGESFGLTPVTNA